ncbi:hypothetical protein C8R44DRAFT_876833 [Mycena epipterygia]|nr:hypothetical protein C8R44DRAFT_876833 [Mycena epipterygia]
MVYSERQRVVRYSLVVSETAAVYNEIMMFEAEGLFVDDFNRLPLKSALVIIARYGFGLRMGSKSKATGSGEDDFDLEEPLRYVSRTRYARVQIPSWIHKLRLKRIDAYDKVWKILGSFIHKHLRTRRTERLGNAFMLIYGGYETAAAAVAATLGFLAIHQK